MSCTVVLRVRWYRSGDDVERRFPVLSTYLGHVRLDDTYLVSDRLSRPLPSTGVTRLPRSYESLRHHTARPVSRELPVDPYRDHRWGFPRCV